MIDEFLRDRGSRAMLRQHQRKALVNDLWLYVRDLPRTGAEYQRAFTDLVAGYLRTVDPAVRRDLTSTRRLAYYLIEHGHHSELIDYAAWLAAQPGRTPPMVRTRLAISFVAIVTAGPVSIAAFYSTGLAWWLHPSGSMPPRTLC